MPVTYISPDAPSFKLRLTVDGKDHLLKFKDKQLFLDETEDAAIIAELDRVIAKSPHISQIVKKIDPEAAEKLAREHRAMMLAQNAGVTGTATSVHDPARKMKAAEEYNRLLAQGMTDEEASAAVQQIFGEEKTVTVEVKENPVIQEVPKESETLSNTEQSADAEIAENKDNPAPQETAKKVFANLGKK